MIDAPPPAARNPFGWIVLGLLFAYLAFGATSRPNSDRPQDRVERYTSRLQMAMSAYETGDNPIAKALSGKSADEPLRELERDLAPRHRTDAIEAGFWSVVRRQLGEPVVEADLAPLDRNKDYAILAEASRPVRRTPQAAKALAARLERRGAASRLAADHVLREAGVRRPTPHSKAFRAIAAGLLVVGVLGGCVLAWIVAVAMFVTRSIHWPGPALVAESGAEADELAVRAATLLTAFLALSFVARLLSPLIGPLAVQAVVFAAMLAVVPFVLRHRPTMAAVGLSTRNLGQNVGLGLWFFLLEIPVTAGVALLCAALLKNLPQPEHPAATALMGSPDLATILVTLFSGAIVAPFWEETMFRGLLFPALRRELRGPVPAALLSSFLFASIHPQGPVLWASLATVALFSCFLAQKTRSLVPSVTMHFAHNATLLAVSLLASRG